MTKLHRSFCAALAAVLTVAIVPRAAAEKETQPPLRLIVPCKAGSPNDLLAHIVARSLSDQSGRKVVVENVATDSDVRPDEHSAVVKVLDCGAENEASGTATTQR